MAEIPAVGRPYVLRNKETGHDLYHRRDTFVGIEHGTGGPDFWWNLDKVQFGYRLRSWKGDLLVLDSNDERQVYSIAPNSGTNQMWNIYPEDDGYYVLLNVATGLALDSNYSDVYTQQPNDGAYQRWQFIDFEF